MQMIRLTVAQPIARGLTTLFIERNGVGQRVCGGGFGIFGHGNVPCRAAALYPLRNERPLYRGQNGQSMGFTAAALAHASRPPMLNPAEVEAGRAAQRQGL